ncbi:glycerophosphodiester phosphodiesterase [Desulfovibrio sp. JC010]|uniref:glycerophosphodiester phosphodiesterase n=1 Tax=Desulfovibrio sp. JC010 TaxID=2593641 RepID=UPI0013D618F6|nr:glycerophosphodiester phosphodiesterase [Desulfovibrio sp. JC010]NDV26043.1 glycerophosphodiester phosphodiesterase [Desulfovibrio sp. JC010]
MMLIGHRGCKYPGYNQNTIRSFEKVTSEGVPAIEFDVQLSADKELVIVHNLDLEEVSTGTGEVSSTDCATLKSLFAGDPKQGEDRIPFLAEVFDFFASCAADKRPAIHMELKGNNTGKQAGELFNEYVAAGKLAMSDMLASSFNWQELEALREVCPDAKIALLDGAIRRNLLLEKTGPQGEQYFAELFAYGNEDYMLPRFPVLKDNLELLEKLCPEPQIREKLAQEIKDCLGGGYYTDELLDNACSMNAASVNLWYRTVSPAFIKKAHARELAVFVYTANLPEEWKNLADMGVDGIFTDFYASASRTLADYNF